MKTDEEVGVKISTYDADSSAQLAGVFNHGVHGQILQFQPLYNNKGDILHNNKPLFGLGVALANNTEDRDFHPDWRVMWKWTALTGINYGLTMVNSDDDRNANINITHATSSPNIVNGDKETRNYRFKLGDGLDGYMKIRLNLPLGIRYIENINIPVPLNFKLVANYKDADKVEYNHTEIALRTSNSHDYIINTSKLTGFTITLSGPISTGVLKGSIAGNFDKTQTSILNFNRIVD